jgi:hypothetical protein
MARRAIACVAVLSCACARTALDGLDGLDGPSRDALDAECGDVPPAAEAPVEIGSMAGHPFVVTNTVSTGFSGLPGDTQLAVIYLLSFGQGCSAVPYVFETAGVTTVEIYPDRPAPGSYTTPGSFEAFAHVWVSNGQDLLLEEGGDGNSTLEGAVTIESIAPRVVGTFDLPFPDGRLTGRFDAAVCPPNTSALEAGCQ